jgi:hypothetical protein
MHAQLYVFIFLVLSYTHRHKHMAVSLTQARAHTHFFCRSTIHTQSLAYMHTLAATNTQGRGRGRRGGPWTSAHVLDKGQVGALRQSGPHMLGPLVANAVVLQAGVRPPTQSVTHTRTQTKRKTRRRGTHIRMSKCG